MSSTNDPEVTQDSLQGDLTTATPHGGDARISGVIIPPLVAVIVITVVANVIVVICICCERKMWKAFNYYVLSLAVADILVGLVVMSFMAVYTTYGYWPLGPQLCTLWVCADFALCTISMLHLCFIAHDRYLAMLHPIQYKSSSHKRWVLGSLAGGWIAGLLLWVPAIIYIRLNSTETPNDCFFLPNSTYILAQSVVVYYLPILTMTYFYVACLRALRTQFRKVQQAGPPAREASTHPGATNQQGSNALRPKGRDMTWGLRSISGSTGPELLSHQSVAKRGGTARDQDQLPVLEMPQPAVVIRTLSVVASSEIACSHSDASPIATLTPGTLPALSSAAASNSQGHPWESAGNRIVGMTQSQMRRRDHIRSLRTLGVVIVTFLFCWLPFCLFWPIIAFCEDCIPVRLYEYSYWAAYLNSTVNPTLYFICNKEFRLAFRKVCRKLVPGRTA